MTTNNAFQVEKDILWEDLGMGVKRQIFGYDDNVMVVKVKFEKGAIGSLHSHIHSQSSFVAEGIFEVTIGEEKKILTGGDGFYAKPHVIHGVACLEAGLLVDSFSPCREDFVKK